MGEQVRPDDVVSEWEDGLPTADDLAPLSQSLIPPELASVFRISPEPPKTAVDVNRASETTLSSLRSNPFPDPDDADEPDPDPDRKKARLDAAAAEEDQSAASRNSKKPRLVWTPVLHRRFIEVVDILGLKNAVPKTIMQLMNVDGLTRENVASHLQKYRLFVRRQGSSDDGPLPSDHRLFASAQQSVAESSSNGNSNGGGGMGTSGNGGNNQHDHHSSYGHHMGMPIPMPYHHHQMMMQMPMNMPSNGHGLYAYHHHNHHQRSDWSGKSSSKCNEKFEP